MHTATVRRSTQVIVGFQRTAVLERVSRCDAKPAVFETRLKISPRWSLVRDGQKSASVRNSRSLLAFLTACMSRVSTLRSKAVKFMVSNTSLRVWPRPRSMCTISPGYFFMALLMNRSRCFWFMQEEAWMCVSTWSRDTAGGRYGRARVQHLRPLPPRSER